MSGSTVAIIIIPVVIVISLAAWLVTVYFAQRHPGNSRKVDPPSTTVSGGSFEASGGRQVSPRRDATPPEAVEYQSEYESNPGS